MIKSRLYGCDKAYIRKKDWESIRTRRASSRLSTAGMLLEKTWDILGQVDERTTLGYIYNPNSEQESLDIMNKDMYNSNKENKKK